VILTKVTEAFTTPLFSPVNHLHASLATSDDIDAVHALLARAGEGLATLGFKNWVPAYPRERLVESVHAGALWVVRRQGTGELQATYTLRTTPIHPYGEFGWGTAGQEARYLGRLAVDPALQGTGIGRWCLRHVAAECTLEGVASVRCDVLSTNQKLRRFYERAGFVSRGEREHSGWRFTVYELMLAR
jgi:ribosomal protein S18 acetylase RimI-like enzyme